MLCETKSRIGFLGACFFIGVILASSVIPIGLLSDVYGRKKVFLGSMLSEIISCYGLLIATSLDQLYVYMVIMGLGHPGRFIVAVNYADEFLTKNQARYLLPLGQLAQGSMVVFCAFYFQVLSKNVQWVQWGNLTLITLLSFFTLISLPESPKFLYSKERFDEARDALEVVAKYNNISNFNKQNIVFDSEKAKIENNAALNLSKEDEEEPLIETASDEANEKLKAG